MVGVVHLTLIEAEALHALESETGIELSHDDNCAG
jgi:hypothetical protein